MGYTTKFSGRFTLDKSLSWEHAAIIRGLNDLEPGDVEGAPDAYCQWVPTQSRTGIEWDGQEKFRQYYEWLQFIIDRYLSPWGYRLSGSVDFQGESIDDVGTLEVVDGNVRRNVAKPGPEAWKAADDEDRGAVLRELGESMRSWRNGSRKAAYKAAIAALTALADER